MALGQNENKVKFGLSNVYYAVATIADDGSATYATPVRLPGAVNLSLEAQGEKQLRQLFQVELTGYWERHYTLGKEAPTATRALSNASIDIVLINLVAPLYYAYGELTGDYAMTDRAIELLEALKPEQNAIVARFVGAGVRCHDALTSQALIQLRKAYCDARKCIYCRIGHRLLSQAAKG